MVVVSKTNLLHRSSTLFLFHDWKRLLRPISRRPMSVCSFGAADGKFALFFPLTSATTCLHQATKTDRKRVFGFEFMEPAELYKALRDSALLSGVKTRFRSKTILTAHPQADWGCSRLAESCIFRGPPRRFPRQECVMICFSEAHRKLDCWFGLAANARQRPNSCGASRIEMSHWRQCVEKGRGKDRGSRVGVFGDAAEGSRVGVCGDGSEGSRVGVCGSP